MDRAAAEREALRLWRNLPLQERLTREQAIAFSVMIAPTLEFDVLDRRIRVIEGWLVLPEVPPIGGLAIGVDVKDVDGLLLDSLS